MISLIMQYWKWLVPIVMIAVIIISIVSSDTNVSNRITDTVSRGTVTQTVSISGFTEAKNTAHLSFPSSGIITAMFVDEGDMVETGDLLATLGSEALIAERQSAVAILTKAEATQAELIAGPTDESRAVTDTTVAQAETALQQTLLTELTKINNAKQALRSHDLTAYATDPDENATAPIISGTYTCDAEGIYTLTIYRSSSYSGYSYRLSGLEEDTTSVTTNQPNALGDCGLQIQFTDEDVYTRTTWEIPVPNTRSSTFVSVKNALALAESQAEQNIAAARAAVDLAKNQATAATAAPRVEALVQANATIRDAQANIARIDSQLRDRSITAPFAGIITDVALVVGEVARTDSVITLLAEDAFEVRARVPEIDITKVVPDQRVAIVFDAKQDEVLSGTVSFVSPLPEEIDGVAYFETLITLDTIPSWLKAGLNADVEIVINEVTDVLRLPQRFVTQSSTDSFVYILDNDVVSTTTVSTGLIGNDGYIEIANIDEGTTVVAPIS